MKVGFVTDSIFLEHVSQFGKHPENPERLLAIRDAIRDQDLARDLTLIDPVEADAESISRVHIPSHLDNLKKAVARAPERIDADTYVSEKSLDAALMAAGGVMRGVDAIASGQHTKVFCAVRPPGHHAESTRAMGFCLINNIAVGARHAQKNHHFGKVFILDWDVHHGNGTQEIFYDDPSVFYFSTHEYPLYPGTGSETETGAGRGKGFTRNVTMSAGNGDAEFTNVFEGALSASVREFKPDLMMISAGFDAHRLDPLANLNVSSEGFGKLTSIVSALAEEVCGGRIVSVLEGGYDLKALGESVCFHLKAMRDEE